MSTLFGDHGPDPESLDAALIRAYVSAGRTLDDLPYTPEFDRLVETVRGHDGSATARRVLHRLQNLRKAGRLPRVGRASTAPPRVDEEDERVLGELVVRAVGSLGQRDQLPYSPEFDALVVSFNTARGRSLDPHSVWRLVAKLAK